MALMSVVTYSLICLSTISVYSFSSLSAFSIKACPFAIMSFTNSLSSKEDALIFIFIKAP